MGISLTGLASGLDTNAMIEVLMKLERLPLQNMEAQRKYLGSQQSLLRSLNTKLDALKQITSDLMYNTTFNVSSGVSSNTKAVDIKTSDTAAQGVYKVHVTQLATSHVMRSDAVFKENETNLKDLIGKKLVINETEVELTSDDLSTNANNKEVLNKLAQKINASVEDVSAAVIMTKEGEYTFTLTSKKTGTGSEIQFSGDNGLLELGDFGKLPQDAIFSVNGIEITRSSNEITDVIQGVTLNLLEEKSDATITVKPDNDKIAGKVEAFVKAYNEVATLIKENTGKEKLLQSNSTVRSIESQLYGVINGLMGSNSPGFKLLSDIGLEIDKGIVDPKLMTGKISFDKEKFMEKLNEDPKAVIEMFTKDESGVAVRLNQLTTSWVNTEGTLTTAIKGYQSSIDLVDENMARMKERLERREAALQKQYAAMEVALSELKNQQNWLAGQLNQLMTPISNNSK